jgi:hypothetical protein
MGACDLVLLYQALNVTASQDPGASKAYPVLKTPGDMARSPGFPWAGERGRTDRQVVKSCLPMTTVIRGMHWCGLLLGLILFKLVVPPL